MRWLVIALVVALFAVAALFVARPRAPSRSGAGVADRAAAGAPAARVDDPAAAGRGLARQKLLQMNTAMDHARPARVIVESRPERRRGESEALWKERTNATAKFDQFVHDGQVPPTMQQALMSVIVDAQDNWRLALEAARRTQPEAAGAEMSDPTLSGIYQQINQDAMRAAESALGPQRAILMHSYLPGMLSYLRTHPFEVAN